MKPRHRTTLGILLFIPLAAILLATFACLPAPVGNPETSKVDPLLVGAYKGIPTDPADKTKLLVTLLPWDDHTYLLRYMTVDPDGKANLQVFKAWLTTLGGATFITSQPTEELAALPGQKTDTPYWAVLRVDKTADGFKARLVDPDSPPLKDLIAKTRDPKALSAAIENVLKAHANDDALYTRDPLTFKKLGENDRDFIQEVISTFHMDGPAGNALNSATIETQPATRPATTPTTMP